MNQNSFAIAHERERAFTHCVEKYRAKPLTVYRFLLPLNVTGPWISGVRSINIHKLVFRKFDWGTIRKFPGWKGFQNSINLQHPQFKSNPARWNLFSPSWFTPFIVNTKQRTVQEAFEAASTCFDILRAFINPVTIRGRMSLQLGGLSSPLGFCLPPAFYGVFNSKGEFQTYYFNTEQYDILTRRLDVTAGKQVLGLLGKMKKMEKGIHARAVEILLKYTQAMDTVVWQNAFLSLWQILEVISRPTGEEARIGKVQGRINSFLGPGPIREDLLRALEASRHRLVHVGKFSQAGSLEVNYLKIIAEWTIMSLVNHHRMFYDRDGLRDFFEHASLPNSHLHTRQKIVSRILKMRTKT